MPIWMKTIIDNWRWKSNILTYTSSTSSSIPQSVNWRRVTKKEPLKLQNHQSTPSVVTPAYSKRGRPMRIAAGLIKIHIHCLWITVKQGWDCKYLSLRSEVKYPYKLQQLSLNKVTTSGSARSLRDKVTLHATLYQNNICLFTINLNMYGIKVSYE